VADVGPVGYVDYHRSADLIRNCEMVVVITMSRVVQSEVCTAIRALLASIPPCTASIPQRADYQIRKAEVFDLLAATDPCLATQAGEAAARARHEAHALASYHY
jgi:hypothetical protein